jgi:hypothetical protein
MLKPKSQIWTVERNGGRSIDHWRLVYSGAEIKARVRFDQIRTEMRQGGVRLLRPDRKRTVYSRHCAAHPDAVVKLGLLYAGERVYPG